MRVALANTCHSGAAILAESRRDGRGWKRDSESPPPSPYTLLKRILEVVERVGGARH